MRGRQDETGGDEGEVVVDVGFDLLVVLKAPLVGSSKDVPASIKARVQ